MDGIMIDDKIRNLFSAQVFEDLIEESISIEVDHSYSTVVELSVTGIADAATAVLYEIEDKWPDKADEIDVIAKLRAKQHELAGRAKQKQQSNFTSDWLTAYADMQVATAIKNILAEVGA